MNLKRQLFWTALAWISLAVFMGLSDPTKLSVVLLIVPFVLLFAACYGLWELLQEIGLRLFGRPRSSKRLGAVVCISVVLLLVLQSLGQLTLRDVITVAAIVSVGYLYVGRMKFGVPKSMG